MSLFDGKRIERVDLNPSRAQPDNVEQAGFTYSPAECDRIWRLVRMSAEGTNVSADPAVIEFEFETNAVYKMMVLK